MSVTCLGKALHLTDTLPKTDEKIKNFTVVNSQLETISCYSLITNTTLLLTILSCNTEVCSLEMKKFQDELEKTGLSLLCIAVSMGLPFAQERWIKQHSCSKLSLFSDFRFKKYGEKLGVLIQEVGLLARACLAIDQEIIQYVQVVPELTQESNYKTIFQSIHAIKGKK